MSSIPESFEISFQHSESKNDQKWSYSMLEKNDKLFDITQFLWLACMTEVLMKEMKF
jgi:hypothetical protein